jgi:hypothetical protein
VEQTLAETEDYHPQSIEDVLAADQRARERARLKLPHPLSL